jgi:hypothetical protein
MELHLDSSALNKVVREGRLQVRIPAIVSAAIAAS